MCMAPVGVGVGVGAGGRACIHACAHVRVHVGARECAAPALLSAIWIERGSFFFATTLHTKRRI